MKTCKQCKDDACPEMGVDMPGCDDFTGEAIEEEPAEWRPTLADYNELADIAEKDRNEVTRLEARVRGFESAISSVVRWAQGDEAP